MRTAQTLHICSACSLAWQLPHLRMGRHMGSPVFESAKHAASKLVSWGMQGLFTLR